MKPKLYLVLAGLFLLTGQLKAQAPNLFNYQGVARNALGDQLPNQKIGLKFTIRQASGLGTIVYSEEDTVTTNQFGLFTISIGSGVVTSGNMATISWGTNSYYLEIGMDPAGGTNYTDLGAQQLLSVPYALYSQSSGNSGSGGVTKLVSGYGLTPDTITTTGTLSVDTSRGMTIGMPTIYFVDSSISASAAQLAQPSQQLVYGTGTGISSSSNIMYNGNQVSVIGNSNWGIINIQPATSGQESSIGFYNSIGSPDSSWVVGINDGGLSNGGFGIYSTQYGGNIISISNPKIGAIEFNGAYTFPTGDGSAGQVLSTDGSGNVTWQTPSGGANGWTLSGNVGTTYNSNPTATGGNFIGTTDDEGLQFRVNGSIAGLIEDFSSSEGDAAFGYQALYNNYENGGSQSEAFGYQALYNNGGTQNDAFGYQALYGNTYATQDVGIGYQALYNNDNDQQGLANYNTAVGALSLYNNIDNANNVAIGYQALYSDDLDDNNSANYNTAVGALALSNDVDGSSNTAIGFNANFSASDQGNSINNSTAIGANAIVNTSNTVQLGRFANVQFDQALMPAGDAGNAGQVLQSNGANTAPTWVTPPAGGTVTSVGSGFGLQGGTITTTGTLSIDTLREASVGMPTIYFVDSSISSVTAELAQPNQQLVYGTGSGVSSSANVIYNGSQMYLDLTDNWGGLHVEGLSGGEASIALNPDNVGNGNAGMWVLATNGSNMNNIADLALYNAGNVNQPIYITQSTNAVTFDRAYTFPTSDGSNGEVLATDGSGNVSWQSAQPASLSYTQIGFGDSQNNLSGSANFTYDGTNVSLYNGSFALDNTQGLYLNGIGDANWTISRDTGNGEFVTSNSLTLTHANGPGEGMTIQNNFGGVEFEILGSTGAITFNKAYTFPTSDGSNGQVLTTDGSGNVTWQMPGSNGGDSAALAYQEIGYGDANNIMTSNSNLIYDAFANVQFHGGNFALDNTHAIMFNGVNDANWIISRNPGNGEYVTSSSLTLTHATGPGEGMTIQNNFGGVEFEILGSTGAITFNKSYTFPTSDGSNGQILTTDGSGNVSWESAAASGTVTSVGSGFGLQGGAITTSGTLSIDTSRNATMGIPTIYFVDSSIAATQVSQPNEQLVYGTGSGISSSSNLTYDGTNISLLSGSFALDNAQAIYLNGIGDPKWNISRNLGNGKTVTSNSIQLTYANGPGEGLIAQTNFGKTEFEILGSTGAITFDSAYTFPTTDGTIGQVLTTDGAGNVSWASPSGGANAWSLTGNSGTTYGTNYIGTSDNTNLMFEIDKYEAGRIENATTANTALGYGSLYDLGSGTQNTGVGVYALYPDVDGSDNTALGYEAGFNASDNGNPSSNITLIGANSFINNIPGAINNATVIGASAEGDSSNSLVLGNHLVAQTDFNGAFGVWTGSNYNEGAAGQVLQSNGADIAPTWVTPYNGANAWNINGNGGTTYGNNFIGTYDDEGLLFEIDGGIAGRIEDGNPGAGSNWNNAIGYQAMVLDSGQNNNALGGFALNYNSGSNNVAVGNVALGTNSGDYNTAIGADAMNNNQGSQNTAVGFGSLNTNLTGSQITVLGSNANVSVDGLNNATAIGAGAVADSSNSVVFGNNSVTQTDFNGALGAWTGSNYNEGAAGQILQSNGPDVAPTWVTPGAGGGWALTGNSGTTYGTDFIGTTDDEGIQFRVDNTISGIIEDGTFSNSSDDANTSLGYQALVKTSNGYNTAVGYQALDSNTTGFQNTAEGTWALQYNRVAVENTAVGYSTLSNVDFDHSGTANWNTAVGADVATGLMDGNSNVIIGYDANIVDNNVNSSNGNTAIGADAQINTQGGGVSINNATALGYMAEADSSNSVVLGNNQVTQTDFNGALGVWNGSNYNEGAAGQVLQSNGPDVAPTWATPTASVSITNAQIGYGSGSNTLTSDPYFIRNGTEIQVSDGVDDIFIGGNGQAGNDYPSNQGGGNANIGLGSGALSNIANGSNNIALGDNALATNEDGSNLIAIGAGADVNANNTYTNSIALGSTTITSSNQFVMNSLITNWNIGGVSYAIPTSQGGSNTALTNDGSGNLSWAMPTASITNAEIGYGSGSNTLTSDLYFTRNGNEIQVSDGVDNIFIGGNGQAGNSYPSNQGGGSANIGLGSGTLGNITNGSNDIALGDNALATNSNGSNLIAIGSGADVNADGYTNSIALGSTTITSSNQFVMNSLITNWNIGGVSYAIPTSQGASNTVLTNDGSGNLSWAAPVASETLFTPSDGGTIGAIVGTNIINPSGALSTLTVTLPSSPTNGQCVELKFTNGVGTITYSGGSVAASASTNVGTGSDLRLFYDAGTSTWY